MPWESLRLELIESLRTQNVVVDETIRLGTLTQIKNKGYQLIGIKLESDIAVRTKRLKKRIARQAVILDCLSKLVGVKLDEYSREDRRNFWRDQEFCSRVAPEELNTFNRLLKEIYHSGSHFMKDEDPNPVCFDELDYVFELQSTNTPQDIDISTIEENMITLNEYRKDRFKKIKYCVWDIGGVVYDFSLEPLESWCRSKTSNISEYEKRKGKFSFNSYMLGDISFDELCRQICEYHYIPFQSGHIQEIKHRLWQGVGEDFPITEKLMKLLDERGIENCVLSNALPELLLSGNYQKFVEPQHRFYSFEIKSLKPNQDSFTHVRDALGIRFDEMIFVDDKAKNVVAATDLGIYSIQYNPNTIEQEMMKLF
jgi:putative hydrolase of the HAD superfamily